MVLYTIINPIMITLGLITKKTIVLNNVNRRRLKKMIGTANKNIVNILSCVYKMGAWTKYDNVSFVSVSYKFLYVMPETSYFDIFPGYRYLRMMMMIDVLWPW